MNFVAMDVETANADMASICSIGAVKFENGEPVSEWYSLARSQDYFDGINISIHGIDEDMVSGAPTYAVASQTLQDQMLRDAVAVTHTHFDRVAIHQASSRWALAVPSCTWLDLACVARRTWTECSSSGYGLADVCRLIGHKFQHHHALKMRKRLDAFSSSNGDNWSRLKWLVVPGSTAYSTVKRQLGRRNPPRGQSRWPSIWRGDCVHR